MTGLLRSELLKIRSTRTTAGIVLGMLGIILLFSLLTGLLTKEPNLVASGDQRNLLGVGDLASIFSALAGIMLVTSEYRYGTIRPTFLFTPRRRRVLGAKVAAGLLAGAAFGIVGGGLGFGLGYACLAGRGIDFALDGQQIAILLLGTVAGTALWGAIGVGVGAIVRSQVGAIIGLLAWAFVAENLIFGLLPGLGRFAPVHRGHLHAQPFAARATASASDPSPAVGTVRLTQLPTTATVAGVKRRLKEGYSMTVRFATPLDVA